MPTPDEFSDQDLQAFLDETLAVEDSARLEQALRDDEALRRRLAAMIADGDAGEHSLGAVWRRRRLTCADRSTLGAYVLGVLPDDQRRYLELHLNVVGCRFCAANLEEIRERSAAADAKPDDRRKGIFDSSVGRLREAK